MEIRSRCTGTDETLHSKHYCCNVGCEKYDEFMGDVTDLFQKTFCPIMSFSVEVVPVDSYELDKILEKEGYLSPVEASP